MEGSAAAAAPGEQTVLLYYKYLPSLLPSERVQACVAWHKALFADMSLTQGRVLVAPEGINGSVAGTAQQITAYCDALQAHPDYGAAGPIDFKTSTTTEQFLFADLNVTVASSICNGGAIAQAPLAMGGKHLKPAQFHKAMEEAEKANELVLLDCRNSYEYAIGRFDGAVDPKTKHYNEFAKYVDTHAEEWKGKKVMMYCTGGIRCEKASAFIRSRGVDDVAQLQGGIHRYLEEYPDGGRFKGLNFVFDGRVAMAPAQRATPVVGRCEQCEQPWERMDGDRVCTVCGSLILLCDACNALPSNRELWCEEHAKVRNLVYSHLQPFSEGQLHALKARTEAMLAEVVAAHPSKRAKRNLKKLLRGSLARIAARVGAMQSGDARQETQEDYVQRCRKCGSTEHLGTCNGLFRAGDQAEVCARLERVSVADARAKAEVLAEEKARQRRAKEEFQQRADARAERRRVADARRQETERIKAAKADAVRRKEEGKARKRAKRLAQIEARKAQQQKPE